MDEQLKAFRDGVIVRAMAEFGGRDPEGGFGSVAGEMLEEAEELVDFVPSPYRGTGTRRRSLGIDGYAFDEADGSLRLVIAEFDGEQQPATVTQTTAKATFSKAVAFVDEAFAGNDDHLPADEDPAADFSGLLQIHQPNITRLRFYLVTDGIAAVTEVVNYKPSSWRTLRDWGIQRNELTAKEDQLLLFAATAGKVPSERQAAAILQIRRRLEAEGFRPA